MEATTRRFPLALDLGSHGGEISSEFCERPALADRISSWIKCDLSYKFVASNGSDFGVVGDDELLPFANDSFDLIVSALNLHWTNDLPGALIQIRNVLKPDGFFTAQLFGRATLRELRSCLTEAESDIRGGAAARVSPFADVQDMAGLLQRANFAMPVADTQTVTVRYSHPLKLLGDLRGMGETAAFCDTGPALTREILMRAVALYFEKFSDADGRVRATFELITISGWSPAPGQPRPLRPGSAKASMIEALEKAATDRSDVKE